ncbi:MAG: ferritin family protein [Byssovorax sp.]
MITKGIDFGTLSLKDALDLAVLVEEEAMDRYGELADQMEIHRTPEAAAFFRFMARNEAKHGAELLKRRHQRFGEEPRAVTRSMLFDVEAPEYDEARAFMSAREAMASAMRSEVKAHDFFAAALVEIQDAQVKSLFSELRDEELVHQRLIQEQLDKLPPDPALRTEDFEDEPAPQ